MRVDMVIMYTLMQLNNVASVVDIKIDKISVFNAFISFIAKNSRIDQLILIKLKFI